MRSDHPTYQAFNLLRDSDLREVALGFQHAQVTSFADGIRQGVVHLLDQFRESLEDALIDGDTPSPYDFLVLDLVERWQDQIDMDRLVTMLVEVLPAFVP